MRLHERDMPGRTPGHPQIADRLLINRPETGGRSIFRRHVRERRAVRDCQGAGCRTKELDTCSEHRGGAELFGKGQCHVGHGDAAGERTVKTDTDELRFWENVRLAQQDRFYLDSSDTPPQHPQGVYHWGVRSPRS